MSSANAPGVARLLLEGANLNSRNEFDCMRGNEITITASASPTGKACV